MTLRHKVLTAMLFRAAPIAETLFSSSPRGPTVCMTQVRIVDRKSKSKKDLRHVSGVFRLCVFDAILFTFRPFRADTAPFRSVPIHFPPSGLSGQKSEKILQLTACVWVTS
jgi:hypothetical protein